MEEKGISQAVIRRLPRYYRYLRDLKEAGKERFSSRELSGIMNVTASQIRQDFNHFGGFGQQGYGYNTNYLYEEIGKILGLDRRHDMVLVGAGNLGQALVKYFTLKKSSFNFVCAFDIDPALISQTVGGIPILPLSALHSYVDEHNVEIVVLTIPKAGATEVAKSLAKTKIKAIWNFAHVDLELSPEIQVENVHLQDSLMNLSYNIRRNQV